MTIDVKATGLLALMGGPSVIAVLLVAAPAMADPATADPVTPGPVITMPVLAPAPTPLTVEAPAAVPTIPEPASAPAPLAVEAPAAAPATPVPAPDGTVQSAAVDSATPPAAVPHLSSPENLPPGTTDAPPDNQGRGVSYLRDLWHAVQTQEVSGKDALLLLTQRPMNADAVPPPGMPANPTPPLPPDAALPPEAPPVP